MVFVLTARLSDSMWHHSGHQAPSNGVTALDYNSLVDKHLFPYWEKKFQAPKPPTVSTLQVV